MKVVQDGITYRVSWQHTPDQAKTAQFIESNAPKGRVRTHYDGHIPLKPKNVIGMSTCLILELLKPAVLNEDKSVKEPPEYKEHGRGYSFQHHTDKIFDKAVARRVSLKDALANSLFTLDQRKAIWSEFNKQWPPHRAQDSQLERKLLKANMELLDMQRINQELAKKLQAPA